MSGFTRSHIVQRLWSSSPEVFKAGVNGQNLQLMGGRNFLIRSDFPVLVFFDGVPVATVNGQYPAIVRIKLGHEEDPPKICTLRFPPGLGATSAGTLVAAQVQGRHGNFCLDYSYSLDTELEIVRPELLPSTTIAQITASIVPGGVGQLPVNLNWVASDFTLPFNQTRINELFIKQIAWGYEDANLGPAPAGEYVYEMIHSSNDSPVGDQEVFWITEGFASGFTCAFGTHYKLPVRAIFADYAGEGSKGMTTVLFATARLQSRIFTMRLMGGYQ